MLSSGAPLRQEDRDDFRQQFVTSGRLTAAQVDAVERWYDTVIVPKLRSELFLKKSPA